MKIGIISDIHSDSQALASALAALADADEILCTGDAISEYEFCEETVSLLVDNDVHCIKGNHEAVLFSGRNPTYLEQCRRKCEPKLMSFLADAPYSRELDFDGARILMNHTGLGEDEYIHPKSPRLREFGSLPFDMVCFGHTHVPFVHQAGNVVVINPGSCSQPMPPEDTGTYATFDTETRSANIHRISK